MDLAYYPGCSLYQSAQHYNHQTKLILSRLGTRVREIEDWNCCGSTSAGKINDFMAVALPARNLGIAEASGFTEMVIPCSACYSRTLVAQKQLEDFPLLKQEINSELAKKVQGTIKVFSILNYLEKELDRGSFSAITFEKLEGLKPACYYGCMHTRFPYDVDIADNVENPQAMEKILQAMGVSALDWNYKTLCCGGSSVIYNSERALDQMAIIMDDGVARGANCFVVSCPMCQMNLESQQEHYCEKHGIKARLPVYFITELIGRALGFSKEDLQPSEHMFVSGMDWTTMCGDSV